MMKMQIFYDKIDSVKNIFSHANLCLRRKYRKLREWHGFYMRKQKIPQISLRDKVELII